MVGVTTIPLLPWGASVHTQLVLWSWGAFTFLLGTSLPSSMGVVHFPLALVSFPVRLHRLPQATVFQDCHCTLLWRMKSFNHPLVWMPPDLFSALGTDHVLPL
jgi:hypothetical protein